MVMRRGLMIAALCALVASLGACTSGEEEAGISSPAPSVAREEPTLCGFTDEQVAVIDEYVDAWNAHDADAVMALYSEDAFEAESLAESRRQAYQDAFDAGVYIRIDWDTCLGRYIDADGQDISPTRAPIEVCGAYCDWTFLFSEDGQLASSRVVDVR